MEMKWDVLGVFHMATKPLIQKKLVYLSKKARIPVIIATQMMESMIDNVTPTRAEVNDVANSVMDGADALMLSGETSIGKNPVEVIKIMSRILNEVENKFDGLYLQESIPEKNHDRFITDSICSVSPSSKNKSSNFVTSSRPFNLSHF